MRLVAIRWIVQERGAVRAWLILLVVNALLAIVVPNDHHSILERGILSRDFLAALLAIALVYGYLVLLVTRVRKSQHLGVWGYIWRSYVLLLLNLLPLAGWTMDHLLRGEAAPAVPSWIPFCLIAVGSPLLAWLLFGRNRMRLVGRVTGCDRREV